MPIFLRSALIAVALVCFLPAQVHAGLCTPGPSTLCLQGDRFQVTVDWENGMNSGQGIVLLQSSNNFGFFRYTDPQTAEVLAQVSDGCTFNGNYWVQLALLSDFGQTITVTDLNLGTQQQYFVTEGSHSQPVIDLGSFPCTAPFNPPLDAPAELAQRGQELLLFDGRFRVDVTWEANGGATGDGQPTQLLDRAGYFTFFGSNPELVVKMVPGTAGGFHTFVASAIGSSAIEMTVTDLCSGDVQVYNQPINNTITIVDDQAFPVECPVIFADGFESGGLLAWSSAVGAL